MPDWFVPAAVFVGWVFVFSLCVSVVIAGIVLVSEPRSSDNSRSQHVEFQASKTGIKATLKAGSGLILVLAGLAGAIYVTLQNWKVVLTLPLILGAGVAEKERRKKGKAKTSPREGAH